MDEGQGGRTARRSTRTMLIVDSAPDARNLLSGPLGRRGWLVVHCAVAAEALDLISGRGFDLVLLGAGDGAASAIHILQEVRGSRDMADLPVVLIGGRGDAASVGAALRAGADDHVPAPCDLDVLAARIERVLARSDRLEALKRSNLALDARIAQRAIEMGEALTELASARADRARLIASIQALHDRLHLLRPGAVAA